MSRYAADALWEMCSVGILRSDQRVCNLRYIGGTTAPAYQRYKDVSKGRRSEKRYGEETIFGSYDSPFLGRPDAWFEFEVQVADGRVILLVDGAKLLDAKDPGNAGEDAYGWRPLTAGGWIGIRNFRPNRVWLDHVRVYRRPARPRDGRAETGQTGEESR